MGAIIVVATQQLDDFDVDKKLRMKDFKLGLKETLGKVETQVIEFMVYDPPDARESKFKLWIDVKTNLPVKRCIDEGSEFVNVETYTEFVLNPQLDAKLFELPK